MWLCAYFCLDLSLKWLYQKWQSQEVKVDWSCDWHHGPKWNNSVSNGWKSAELKKCFRCLHNAHWPMTYDGQMIKVHSCEKWFHRKFWMERMTCKNQHCGRVALYNLIWKLWNCQNLWKVRPAIHVLPVELTVEKMCQNQLLYRMCATITC